MPGEQIPVSNPPPLPSHLPDSVLELSVRLKPKPLPDHVRQSLYSFQRAAEYIAAGTLTPIRFNTVHRLTVAAMIFLRDNVLLESELQLDHVKPRLLGMLKPSSRGMSYGKMLN
jgi:xylulose-5-phosphate/fructose-6-phosphate phosphoketolase